MAATSPPIDSFLMLCRHCQQPVTARGAWVGRDVKCPHCGAINAVPQRPADGRPVRADAPTLRANRYFNFGCGRCKTLLEGHTGMVGQRANCPTCGATFRVPYLNPATGRPEGLAQVDEDGSLPTPMHAYAASGEQAPRIERRPDGTDVIICPRCKAASPIDADTCVGCRVPFVIEATANIDDVDTSGMPLTAVVFGLVGLGAWYFPIFALPGVVALVLAARCIGLRPRLPRDLVALGGGLLGLTSLLFAALKFAGVI